ncbi:hypothetical protein [Paenibacillus luteus]|uniref:hypothetical protein n=1 Tax=Paenibacillus luteus TaxID=2545753 RepID=UPI0019D67428|nr:hypothetical protein [Paenibacillus luteus]
MLANGWTVHTSDVSEAYGILATDPVNGEHYKIQVKTICYLDELIFDVRRFDGTTYVQSEADYIVAVYPVVNHEPRIFIFENDSREYYCSSSAGMLKRWVKLTFPIVDIDELFSDRRKNLA